MKSLHQVLATCPNCRVEAALVELYDPALAEAVEGSCRLCSYQTQAGVVLVEGRAFQTEAEVLEALAQWAYQEGELELEVFAQANFGGHHAQEIAQAILEGKPVETGFDVIAWLFPSMSAGASVQSQLDPRKEREAGFRVAAARADARPLRLEKTEDPPPPLQVPTEDPYLEARVLASVMMADGMQKPEEQQFLQNWLQKNQRPQPRPEDIRVWRPQELGRPKEPEKLIAAMRQIALSDRELDGSEVRVIREFARAWQVPFDESSLPRGGPITQLGTALMAWLGGVQG